MGDKWVKHADEWHKTSGEAPQPEDASPLTARTRPAPRVLTDCGLAAVGVARDEPIDAAPVCDACAGGLKAKLAEPGRPPLRSRSRAG